MGKEVQGWRPAVGERLDDRYTLTAERNVGLTGVVYAARDERLGEDVVVKIFHPVLFEDPYRANNILRIQRARAFVHDHIGKLQDVVIAKYVYTVEEPARGVPLDEWMSDRLAPTDVELLSIMQQLVSALKWVHQIGVHGHLRPGNIFVEERPEGPWVTLKDPWFLSGRSKIDPEALPSDRWLAPEQHAAGWGEHRMADVHAVGLLLGYLITGGRTLMGELKLGEQGVDAPDNLDRIFERATSSEPTKRYQSLDQFLSEVELACQGLRLPLPKARRAGDTQSEMLGVDAIKAASPVDWDDDEDSDDLGFGEGTSEVTLVDDDGPNLLAEVARIASGPEGEIDAGRQAAAARPVRSSAAAAASPDDDLTMREISPIDDAAIARARQAEAQAAEDEVIELGDSMIIEVDEAAAAKASAAMMPMSAPEPEPIELGDSVIVEVGEDSVVDVVELGDSMIIEVAEEAVVGSEALPGPVVEADAVDFDEVGDVLEVGDDSLLEVTGAELDGGSGMLIEVGDASLMEVTGLPLDGELAAIEVSEASILEVTGGQEIDLDVALGLGEDGKATLRDGRIPDAVLLEAEELDDEPLAPLGMDDGPGSDLLPLADRLLEETMGKVASVSGVTAVPGDYDDVDVELGGEEGEPLSRTRRNTAGPGSARAFEAARLAESLRGPGAAERRPLTTERRAVSLTTGVGRKPVAFKKRRGPMVYVSIALAVLAVAAVTFAILRISGGGEEDPGEIAAAGSGVKVGAAGAEGSGAAGGAGGGSAGNGGTAGGAASGGAATAAAGSGGAAGGGAAASAGAQAGGADAGAADTVAARVGGDTGASAEDDAGAVAAGPDAGASEDAGASADAKADARAEEDVAVAAAAEVDAGPDAEGEDAEPDVGEDDASESTEEDATVAGKSDAESPGDPELPETWTPKDWRKYKCPAGMSRIRRTKWVTLRSGKKVKDYVIWCIERYEFPGAGRPPRVNVSLGEAKQACRARGRRLCSKREWRGGCGGKYPYGREYDPTRCNTVRENGMPRPVAAAGSKPQCKSGWGTFDMVGNVAEWTSDGSVNGGSAYKDGKSGTCFRSSRRSGGHAYVGFRCCADAKR